MQGLPSLDIANAEGGRFELSELDVPTFERNVQAALPTLIRGTVLRFKDQKARGLAIGIPMAESDVSTRAFLIEKLQLEDSPWPGEEECLISALIASQLRVNEGDSIQCLVRRGFKKLRIIRVVSANIWNRLSSEHGVIVDLKWLQNATALPGEVDRFRLFLTI